MNKFIVFDVCFLSVAPAPGTSMEKGKSVGEDCEQTSWPGPRYLHGEGQIVVMVGVRGMSVEQGQAGRNPGPSGGVFRSRPRVTRH